MRFSREAYSRLPEIDSPAILDIGCGSGMVTLELARISRGRITGIDTDRKALARLKLRIKESGLEDRIEPLNRSILRSGLPDNHFDLVWDEGTLHVLDPGKSAPEIRRILKPGGILVMNETLSWLKRSLPVFEGYGFREREKLPLPENLWWKDYYAPIEKRINELTIRDPGSRELKQLESLRNEIEMVRSDPGQFDTAFLFMENTG